MHLDDAVNNREAETRALAHRFRRKKWVKQFSEVFFRYSAPRVRDDDFDPRLVIRPPSFKRDGSALGHRLC